MLKEKIGEKLEMELFPVEKGSGVGRARKDGRKRSQKRLNVSGTHADSSQLL